MVTTHALEACTRRTMEGLRTLSPHQRDVVFERILRSDPELSSVLPTLLATYTTAKRIRRMGPLRRDSPGVASQR